MVQSSLFEKVSHQEEKAKLNSGKEKMHSENKFPRFLLADEFRT